MATRVRSATYVHFARQDAESATYLLEHVACFLAEESTMQVLFAFLDAKHTMQHVIETHNAICLLLAQQEVNKATCPRYLAKWHTKQLRSMTCNLSGLKDSHCALPPYSPKCRPYNLSHACSRKSVYASFEQRKQTLSGLQTRRGNEKDKKPDARRSRSKSHSSLTEKKLRTS